MSVWSSINEHGEYGKGVVECVDVAQSCIDDEVRLVVDGDGTDSAEVILTYPQALAVAAALTHCTTPR